MSAHPVENDGNMPASTKTHRESMSEFVNDDGDNSCCHKAKNRHKVFWDLDRKGASAEGEDGPVPRFHGDWEAEETETNHAERLIFLLAEVECPMGIVRWGKRAPKPQPDASACRRESKRQTKKTTVF